jgi:hypothetical protein
MWLDEGSYNKESFSSTCGLAVIDMKSSYTIDNVTNGRYNFNRRTHSFIVGCTCDLHDRTKLQLQSLKFL